MYVYLNFSSNKLFPFHRIVLRSIWKFLLVFPINGLNNNDLDCILNNKKVLYVLALYLQFKKHKVEFAWGSFSTINA